MTPMKLTVQVTDEMRATFEACGAALLIPLRPDEPERMGRVFLQLLTLARSPEDVEAVEYLSTVFARASIIGQNPKGEGEPLQ